MLKDLVVWFGLVCERLSDGEWALGFRLEDGLARYVKVDQRIR